MRRVAVDSTSIASIGYEPRRGELEIEFRENGIVYRYFNVPAEEFEALMAAKSKGTYVNRTFKPKNYRYMSVHKGRANSG
jgi:KTSC domain